MQEMRGLVSCFLIKEVYMGIFSRFRRRRRYKFNKFLSDNKRRSYFGYGTYANPIAYRKSKKASYVKSFNLRGYKTF